MDLKNSMNKSVNTAHLARFRRRTYEIIIIVLLQRRLNECNVSSRPNPYYTCLPSLYLLSEEEGEIMRTHKADRMEKQVIEYMTEKGGWVRMRMISDDLEIRFSSIDCMLKRLEKIGLIERRDVNVPKVVYPEAWNEWGDYARRVWRKKQNMPHRFKCKYEFRV